MVGAILIYCPPMPILATANPFVRECQELPSTGMVVVGGVEYLFNITFPKVKTRWQSWGEWLVDEVPAKGRMRAGGGDIAVTMDEERVTRTTWRTMAAQPCRGVGHVELLDRIWNIDMTFPLCVATAVGLGIYKYVAEAVMAQGTVTLN